MTKCTECDVIDGGITTRVEDFETYEVCTQCNSEASIIEIDQLNHEEDLELAAAERENFEDR